MFYPEGLVDFALEKSFIPKLPFFLLHRCVQKWLFAKYCPHFSFITLVIVLLTKAQEFEIIYIKYKKIFLQHVNDIFQIWYSKKTSDAHSGAQKQEKTTIYKQMVGSQVPL